MKSTAVISPINTEKRKTLEIKAGDTVRVHQKIQEKGKTRLQMFEGLVLTHKGGKQAGATFTVRRVVDGVGVEKTFPLYSPMIDKIEVVKRSKVRRAKLYYIREKAAKEIRKQMKHARALGKMTSTGSDIEDKEAIKRAAEEEAKAQAAIQAEKEAAEAAAAEAKTAAEAAAKAAAEEMPLEEVKAEEVGEVSEDK